MRAIEGAGFEVRRPFPTPNLPFFDPFLLLDHVGPMEFGPHQGIGTDWHPHRGFETVSYVLEGENQHRDSMGNHGVMHAGDTQWMTAGGGVLHKEGPTDAIQETGGRAHSIQLWVNLPAKDKLIPAAYQNLTADRIAVTETDGAVIRVIAGTLFDTTGPGTTHTPIEFAHVTLQPGATVRTDLMSGHHSFVYPLVGTVVANGADTPADHMADLGGASAVELVGAGTEPAEVLILGGQPIGEPVARSGPFVMNTAAEIEESYRLYESGQLAPPPPGR